MKIVKIEFLFFQLVCEGADLAIGFVQLHFELLFDLSEAGDRLVLLVVTTDLNSCEHRLMHALHLDFACLEVFDLHLQEGDLLLEDRALFDELLLLLAHFLFQVVDDLLVCHEAVGWHGCVDC